MSRLHEYNQERTGIAFDEVDDLLKPGSSGGATATATSTATPKATSTPTPGDRTFKIGKLWYVVDIATGQPISPGYTTESEANYHATYTHPQATAVPPTATPAPTSTPTPAAANYAGTLNPGAYSEEMLGMADVGAGPTAAVQSGGMPAIGAPSPTTPTATGAAPPPATAGAKGGTTGTAGGGSTTSASPSNVPPEIAGLLDTFEGFSDKDVVDAYYAGEITREQLAGLITVRNTSAKGETKYTTASLDRYLNQVDAAKPVPKRTAMDVLGESFGNISRQFNPQDPSFGGKGSFGSQGQSTQGQKLFTAQSEGEGLIPYTNPGGSQGLAGTVVNNQLFPNLPVSDQYLYSGSPASILQQSGVYVAPNTSPAAQMQALGNLIALREFIMQNNPGASPSQVNAAAVSMMQPANPNHDPSAGALANLSDPLATIPQFAHGGGMTLKEPVVGMGMVSKRPLFMAAEAGKQEKVQKWGDGLKFTPTNRDIPLGREREVGIPVEGRQQGRRPPTTQMLTLMRMLGIPGFALGGTWGWDQDDDNGDQIRYPSPGSSRTFGSGDFGSNWLMPNYTSPGLEGFTPNTFLNALQSELQGQHADQRQTELNQYHAALNDVAGISNIGALERQRQAYDPRFGMAGLNTPVGVDAPLTGPMGQLPPGVRYNLESPAARQAQLSGLNERQRGITLSKLQSPSIQMLADLKDAIDDRDIGDIAELLGIPRDQVEDIIRATRQLQGDSGSGGGGTIGGGWGGGFGGGF